MTVTALALSRTSGNLDWRWSNLLRLVILAVAAGLMLGILGPFGTYASMDGVERLRFWSVVLLSAAILHIPALWLADQSGAAISAPTLFRLSIATIVAAASTTPVIAVVIATLNHATRLPEFGRLLPFVLAISAPMQILSYAVLRRSGQRREELAPLPGATEQEVAPVQTVPDAPPLLQRLPPALRGALICLEMQDHYVRVHTSVGSALAQMRMRDAEREAEPVAGYRVHRSWWVAEDAISGVTRDGRSYALKLNNGMVVPISRHRIAELRSAPFLRER
ncbi:LytTR family transcriptional regulator DNA-binding domain-containing protein [Sphingomonas sp. GlSt437]|uniref:LytTR family DNA-binding domain-containing protein n=1 Tax=Sphingomonas sp. GlSt437 TaxID=3389970 RepID=UPI003A852EB5